MKNGISYRVELSEDDVKNGIPYIVTLTPSLNTTLEYLTVKLDTTKREVFRRSMLLLKHAVEADRVELHTQKDGQDVTQQVLIK